METEMILASMIYYYCLFQVGLAGIVAIGVFVEKRLSPSSWFRKPFAVMAGIGASVISLVIVYAIGSFLSLNNSYSLSLISISVFVAVVLVSILGGYIGGKVARQNEIVYGFLIGIGLLFLSVRFGDSYLIGRSIDNLDLVFIHAARFGATLLGSYIALFQRQRNLANLTTTSEA
jgi:hypothetical protein